VRRLVPIGDSGAAEIFEQGEVAEPRHVRV
jgi:hypothetical protein